MVASAGRIFQPNPELQSVAISTLNTFFVSNKQLESFAQPCFACHVSVISIETILHVFETSFLLVCRWVGRSTFRSHRQDLGVSFVDAWSVCKVTQAVRFRQSHSGIPKRYQEPVLVFRELKPKFAVSAHQL